MLPPRDAVPCIRCGENPAIDDNGYCGYCHWVTSCEIERGLDDLRMYLAHHASADDHAG